MVYITSLVLKLLIKKINKTVKTNIYFKDD